MHWYGADISFDKRTLTDYLADRKCTTRTIVIANRLASVAASVKSLFQVPQLAVAPIAA